MKSVQLEWAWFPRSAKAPPLAERVVETFRATHPSFTSAKHKLESNDVLRHVAGGLVALGFKVERSKKADEKISVPVLYGNNGKPAKYFQADAHHVEQGFVVEVEAGRAVINNQFLKDLFQACMMDGVQYLAIAVRNVYEGGGRSSADFDKVVNWFDTLYASDRMRLPLKGILIIGY